MTALRWEPAAPLRSPRYDVGAVQVGSLLLSIGGYAAIDRVLGEVEILDLSTGEWQPPLDMPDDLPHSHHAVATDGSRYAYVVGGQVGPNCSPASPIAYVLDLARREWTPLPPLPATRYAGAMELIEGRLHYCGGSLPDRITPASDHWSIEVHGGRAVGPWREEAPIPRGGPHRGSAVVGGAMYVFGGQASDFGPAEGDPDCHCDPKGREDHYADVYRFDTSAGWQRAPDLPVTTSHTEQSILARGDRALIVGGSIDYEESTRLFTLTDAIRLYDARQGAWSVVGRLPYRVKSMSAGYWDGWLYAMGGQRDVGPDDPTPGDVIGDAWRCRFWF